ncbi:hypothetical protein [Paenibacillus sp. GP183]|jgi:hypothetical protein|uniref:hypothetical protein n=1 Tax=Paenibacillus sp. GP183 TaxID=1882751 RepID=UPI000894DC67|nr:hypothetical protein [Paenibacillus sp. GP183]SEB87747.1 hypothetical protein SAMN05443246_2215 [Paenibacillus sp. GP183]
MRKKIGCYHAHYSNIEHIERALNPYDVEIVHFVDPGLDRIKADVDFTNEIAQRKIKDTLDWIAKCHLDAILITCTFFTANLQQETLLSYPIPIIKIDDPLFQNICQLNKQIIMAFTNPNTVKGTMDQLINFARIMEKELQAESVLLENTFDLIMQGKKEEYIEVVTNGLNQIVRENPDKTVVAAQLSMVPAAQGIGIGNHLNSLSRYMEELLNLDIK